MNSHYLSTSHSNPQFYAFSQLFERTPSCDKVDALNRQWKDQTRQAAWLGFWEREGYELLERKWHKQHPEYKQDIELATLEQRTEWQALWEQHASDQSAHIWHVFNCVFENYERDLANGLQSDEQTFVEVDEHLSHLDIRQSERSSASAEGSAEDESYLTANDDPELLDEEQQLRLLGLPTSFGMKVASKRRKPKQQPASESESENDISSLNMASGKDKDQVDMLHALKSRVIKKNKRQKNSKIPQFMRDDNLMLKYWFKRFSLFSRFDRGILLDRESWFSVTPEKIAKQTARRLACDVIVDAFCGCGGNAIQFANTCGRVIAIDIDASKLAMAKQNASIYGVAHKIEFIHADFLQFASSTRLRPDVVFLSPPWGGPNYRKNTFDIEQDLVPLGATQLMQYARRLTDNIGFYLPRSSNTAQVIALANVGQQCEMEHNYLDTRLVAITAYYGNNLVKSEQQHTED